MISIVVFEHAGLYGAAPAAQAIGVSEARSQADFDTVQLWPGARTAAGAALSFSTGRGTVKVLCGRVSLMQVQRATLAPLNPCLRGALTDHPHVVGVLWLTNGASWLVDMSRFTPAGL